LDAACHPSGRPGGCCSFSRGLWDERYLKRGGWHGANQSTTPLSGPPPSLQSLVLPDTPILLQGTCRPTFRVKEPPRATDEIRSGQSGPRTAPIAPPARTAPGGRPPGTWRSWFCLSQDINSSLYYMVSSVKAPLTTLLPMFLLSILMR
jgi:hypothetical protein